jgi:hypothetical protein
MKTLTAAMAIGLLTLVAAPRLAHANSGFAYICSTVWYPGSGISGTSGVIWSTFYSGPSCSGSYLASADICSNGATSSACELGYLHSSEQMNALWGSLTRASVANEKVWFNVSYIGLTSLTFYSGGY